MSVALSWPEIKVTIQKVEKQKQSKIAKERKSQEMSEEHD
jgi:hypothetical protein